MRPFLASAQLGHTSSRWITPLSDRLTRLFACLYFFNTFQSRFCRRQLFLSFLFVVFRLKERKKKKKFDFKKEIQVNKGGCAWRYWIKTRWTTDEQVLSHSGFRGSLLFFSRPFNGRTECERVDESVLWANTTTLWQTFVQCGVFPSAVSHARSWIA